MARATTTSVPPLVSAYRDDKACCSLAAMMNELPVITRSRLRRWVNAYQTGRMRLRVTYMPGTSEACWYARGLSESHTETLGFAKPEPAHPAEGAMTLDRNGDFDQRV